MRITQKTLQDKLKGFKKIYNRDDNLQGTNLWEAILHENDVRDGYGTLRKIYEDDIEFCLNDKWYRDEHMPKHNWNVYITLGTQNRSIHIREVRAGNRTQAIKQCEKDINKEFKGIKHKKRAMHVKPEEHMTEEEFEKMVYENVWKREPQEWVEGLDVEDDKEIAKVFNLDCEITGFIDNIDDAEWNIDSLRGFCKGCEHPLVNEHFDVNKVCPNCDYDLRTTKEKVVDRLAGEDEE